MKRICKWLALAGGVVLLIVLVLKLFPDDAKIIDGNLKRIAQLASFGATEPPLSRLQNTRELANFFAEDAKIVVDVPGASTQSISGREELFQMALAARNTHPGAKVELLDVHVRVDPGKNHAISEMTMNVRLANQPELFVEELKVGWKKIDGHWRIIQVETVKTLQ